MPRIARLAVVGIPHHITHRGNHRADIFHDDADYVAYLGLLKDYAQTQNVAILAYCLMSNHIHLVLIPDQLESLSAMVGSTHRRFTQYYNHRYDQSGHLWQGRFHSCPMDDAHTLAAVRYIECNPVRSSLVEHAWEYLWSSAAVHVGRRESTGILDIEEWKSRWPNIDWQKELEEPENEKMLRILRIRTRNGRPMGDNLFLQKLNDYKSA
jgi:putative transposase